MRFGEDVVATRPPHVPESAMRDFDLYRDPALQAEPHARILELLPTLPPLFWTPRNGGHWLALSHRSVVTVLREPDRFSSALVPPEHQQAMMTMMPEGTPRMPQMTPIFMDPPDHGRYRAPLQRAFSPRLMLALKPRMEAMAGELIDAVIGQGDCDFFSAIAEPFPVRVFLRMMGLPTDRIAEYRALVREIFEPVEDHAAQATRGRRMVEAMEETILARRDAPRDDLISELWALEIDGQPMTLELMEDYCSLLFLAGLDTVINGISYGVRHLAMNPRLQAQLRAEPDLIVDAAEEMLRRYTFSGGIRRVAKDTMLDGHVLKKDEIVVTYLAAADLDPSEFPDPATFDPRRAHKAHLAFGAGPHRCVGSHLARVELQTLYRVVLDRFPPFRLDPARPPRFHVGMMLAMTSLPIRWD
jgi:cytochrome P450